ncbi:DUF418 domain-containing protein [Litorihabitans aurantiacus]|uniref:DUF418 domain-containing protein n=1 Tax=Litorihabitans aurantiacus TaxID=1930061 RepID=A0AA37XAJ8_9MICO|nr:DUF418 domain-containing protein [Litorihabitans aurantiacus]GMA30014.1 hypothetical protein GCM10025875_00060 [Litorihabitans aurantiacus]GMA33462.1 hypothetical protein GCM10025875_34540 [Litorihabitans aurantiacus]
MPETADLGFVMLQTVTGMCAGLGYVALFGLLTVRIQRRGRAPGRVVWALQAVGKRSLSCYLAQSVLVAPLLSAWGLGLGAHLGSAGAAAIAVAVWLVILVGACALERAGRRGPAEVLLRRLSYPRARVGATA